MAVAGESWCVYARVTRGERARLAVSDESEAEWASTFSSGFASRDLPYHVSVVRVYNHFQRIQVSSPRCGECQLYMPAQLGLG
jgi:hypothetical protein